MLRNAPSRLTNAPAKMALAANGDSLKVCQTPALCWVSLDMPLSFVRGRHGRRRHLQLTSSAASAASRAWAHSAAESATAIANATLPHPVPLGGGDTIAPGLAT